MKWLKLLISDPISIIKEIKDYFKKRSFRKQFKKNLLDKIKETNKDAKKVLKYMLVEDRRLTHEMIRDGTKLSDEIAALAVSQLITRGLLEIEKVSPTSTYLKIVDSYRSLLEEMIDRI